MAKGGIRKSVLCVSPNFIAARHVCAIRMAFRDSLTLPALLFRDRDSQVAFGGKGWLLLHSSCRRISRVPLSHFRCGVVFTNGTGRVHNAPAHSVAVSWSPIVGRRSSSINRAPHLLG